MSIFSLHVLSQPPLSFCLMNLVCQTLHRGLLSLPRSGSSSIIYGLLPRRYTQAWPRVGWSGHGGMGGGFRFLHVSKQTEIFMYVCLCESDLTCTPSSVCVHACVRVFMSVVYEEKMLICVLLCTRVLLTPRPILCQVMRKALSFDSAPKIRLGTSITHELLCTCAHNPPRKEELAEHASPTRHNDTRCTLR